jgi:hypothetical protein
MLSTAAREHTPPGPEDGLFVDGPSILPLLPAMHIVAPSSGGWVCVRPAHTGQPCTIQLPEALERT